MLNLDEAINRFEKLASDCEFNLNMHKNHVMNLSVNDIERIQEHLEENRQLAEWLRELKIYKENTKNTPKWMRELRAYREAHEEIKALPQIWEEGNGIQKCLRCIERWLEKMRGDTEWKSIK